MKQKAKNFAIKAHEGQFRKVGKEPYINHPVRVAKRLEESGASVTLVSAGYLHDVVEDTAIDLKEIEAIFGEQVAYLVGVHTENKSLSWKERKQQTIDILKEADLDVKQLIIADRLDNLLSTEQALKEYGESIWKKFNAGKRDQKWYNESMVESMYEGLRKDQSPPFFTEFKEAVHRVFS